MSTMGCTLSFSQQIARMPGYHATFPRLIGVSERPSRATPCHTRHPQYGPPAKTAPSASPFECDEFDSKLTQYLVVTDPGMGSILGSLRLLPTDRAHLLNTLFPDLCQAHIPQGAHIREVSQIYLHPELRNQRRRVMLQLASALVQYGLLTGISAYTTVMESIWSDFLGSIGWHITQLGPDRMVDGISLRASQIHLDNNTLHALRARNCLAECDLQFANMRDQPDTVPQPLVDVPNHPAQWPPGHG
ncbi:acyl-homoserine-lactone synthase [Sphingobium yanoikuyae]|nr:acyl-homoserine-lactone synthase [Sphingobium yanoikuyae]